MRSINWILAFSFVIQLTSCIGEDYIEVEPSQTPRVVIFGQSGPLDRIQQGEKKRYSASYFNEFGVKTDDAVSWASLNSSIVQIDSEGNVEALQRGIAQISASSNSRTAFQAIEVFSIERVEVSATKNALFLNDSLRLSAIYFDENDQMQMANFSWNSSDPSIASIDSQGWLTALSKGQTSITATTMGVESNPFLISVFDDSNAVASLQITVDTNQLFVGQEFQFLAEARNGFGSIISPTINWSSSNKNIVEIDGNGIARAKATGITTIQANADGIQTLPFQLVVLEAISGFRQGAFVDENGYSVSGNVEIRPSATNNYELSFTNFDCQPGPALYINLSNSNNSAGIEIDVLRQLRGDFTVPLPANIQLDDYDYVLIWCKSANLSFGSALLN